MLKSKVSGLAEGKITSLRSQPSISFHSGQKKATKSQELNYRNTKSLWPQKSRMKIETWYRSIFIITSITLSTSQGVQHQVTVEPPVHCMSCQTLWGNHSRQLQMTCVYWNKQSYMCLRLLPMNKLFSGISRYISDILLHCSFTCTTDIVTVQSRLHSVNFLFNNTVSTALLDKDFLDQYLKCIFLKTIALCAD